MSDMASLKRLIKVMSREPNGQSRADMLAGINAMLDALGAEETTINVMEPLIDFDIRENLTYDSDPAIEVLKKRKEREDKQAVAQQALENIRIKVDPVTGDRHISYAEPIPTDETVEESVARAAFPGEGDGSTFTHSFESWYNKLPFGDQDFIWEVLERNTGIHMTWASATGKQVLKDRTNGFTHTEIREHLAAEAERQGYAEKNNLGVDRNGRFFTKDRKGKPTRKAQPASAENPSWGTFA